MLLALVLLVLGPPAEARTWLWPVRGHVVRPFSLGADPFARGWHRGIDIAAPSGRAVRAACAGRVRFAGEVPGGGRVVTERCGPWSVTYLELAGVSVRRGSEVAAGERLGVGGGRLHLGVRRASDRRGYIDPLLLLPSGAPGAGPPPLPLAPALRRPRGAAPVDVVPPPPGRLPAVAWVGLALLLVCVPTLALVRGRRTAAMRGRGGAGAAARGSSGDGATP